MKFIVAALPFMLLVYCAPALQPIAGTNMSRWLDYQEKLNQSREELRSRGTFPAVPVEGTISVAGLRHPPRAKALKALQHGLGYVLALHPETQAAAEEHLRFAARMLPDAHSMLAELYQRTGREVLAEAERKMYGPERTGRGHARTPVAGGGLAISQGHPSLGQSRSSRRRAASAAAPSPRPRWLVCAEHRS